MSPNRIQAWETCYTRARQELSHYGLDIYVFEMSLFRAGLSTDPAFKSQWSPSDDTVNGME